MVLLQVYSNQSMNEVSRDTSVNAKAMNEVWDGYSVSVPQAGRDSPLFFFFPIEKKVGSHVDQWANRGRG